MRLLLALALMAGCYQQTSFAPCTLTCSSSVSCPGDLVCGSDGLCHAAGAAICADQPPIDAEIGDVPRMDAVTDAKPFALSDCPVEFNVTLPSTSTTSRYLVYYGSSFSTARAFWSHQAICESLTPSLSHLLIPDTLQEAVEMAEHIQTIANADLRFYVGLVQNPAANLPMAGWIRFDGTGVSSGDAMWDSGEPRDGNNTEGDHYSQLAVLDKSTERLLDYTGLLLTGAVCECDGKQVSVLARMYIDDDPNNPN